VRKGWVQINWLISTNPSDVIIPFGSTNPLYKKNDEIYFINAIVIGHHISRYIAQLINCSSLESMLHSKDRKTGCYWSTWDRQLWLISYLEPATVRVLWHKEIILARLFFFLGILKRRSSILIGSFFLHLLHKSMDVKMMKGWIIFTKHLSYVIWGSKNFQVKVSIEHEKNIPNIYFSYELLIYFPTKANHALV